MWLSFAPTIAMLSAKPRIEPPPIVIPGPLHFVRSLSSVVSAVIVCPQLTSTTLGHRG